MTLYVYVRACVYKGDHPRTLTEMQIIGLTGGIGTGKSTACRILREIDPEIVIMDADVLSHEAVKPGNLPHFLLKQFILPRECFDSVSGELNRSKLAEMIFAQTPKARVLKRLVERCIHPWVVYKMILGILFYWLSGRTRIFLDIPLLFEAKLQWMCTRTVLIDVIDSETQLARILKRNPQLSEKDARNRMAAQLSMETKRKMANCVIRNDGDLDNLKNKLKNEFKKPNLLVQIFFYLILPIILIVYFILNLL